MSAPIFLRPVEINSENDTIGIRTAGGGAYTDVTITRGTYASILSVWYSFQIVAQSVGGSIQPTIHPQNTVPGTFECLFGKAQGSVDYDVYLSRNAMLLFGSDTQTFTVSPTWTTPKFPLGTWKPNFQNGNQDRFKIKHSIQFSGTTSKTGLISGIKNGPDVFHRELTFRNELASNLVYEAISELQDYIFTFEYFFQQSRTSSPSDPSYTTTKGFWFVPDVDNIINNHTIFPRGTDGSTITREGIMFDMASSPDLWAYCQFSADESPVPEDIGAPSGRQYYHITFEIHTLSETPNFAITTVII